SDDECTLVTIHSVMDRTSIVFFFFDDTPPAEIYTLSLHDALPISGARGGGGQGSPRAAPRPAEPIPWPAGSGPRRLEGVPWAPRSEEHASELQSRRDLVCRLLLEKKKTAE